MYHVCAGIQLDEKSDFPSGTNLLISPKIQQTLQLPRSPVTLQVGQKTVTCKIQTFSSNSSLIRIRKDFADLLYIPDGIQLNLIYDPQQKKLLLGPVFGVLITSLIHTPEGIFGPASSFCKELVQGAKGKGILAYIFTLNDVDYENQSVNGWIWLHGKWTQKILPFPDSVYNRLASRKSENRAEMVSMIETFKRVGVHYFNEHFLNKWQVHQAFSGNSEVSRYLPSTYLFKGFPTIKEAVERFPQIYLKPANGSLGKGIYKISRAGNRYTCQYSTMSGNVQKSYQKLSDLYKSIAPRISRAPYLVQQGLRLVRINGNPVDFRSLVQKDGTGKWAVTSIVGRIGQDDSIVSNLARGGTIMPVAQALLAASPWNGSRPSKAHLYKTSLLLAENLESSIEGNYAELGIDLAVDTGGRIWLLEINAKPSKNDDQILSDENKTRPSVKRLLDYILYLKGISKQIYRNPKRKLALLRKKTLKRKKR